MHQGTILHQTEFPRLLSVPRGDQGPQHLAGSGPWTRSSLGQGKLPLAGTGGPNCPDASIPLPPLKPWSTEQMAGGSSTGESRGGYNCDPSPRNDDMKPCPSTWYLWLLMLPAPWHRAAQRPSPARPRGRPVAVAHSSLAEAAREGAGWCQGMRWASGLRPTQLHTPGCSGWQQGSRRGRCCLGRERGMTLGLPHPGNRLCLLAQWGASPERLAQTQVHPPFPPPMLMGQQGWAAPRTCPEPGAWGHLG